MELRTDAQLTEDKIVQLEQEIAELERTTKKMGMNSMRVLGMGCSSVSLLTISALGFWLLPHPIQIGYFLVLIIIGLIGIFIAFRFISKKTKESLSKDNEQLKEIVAQLNEKREKLKKLKQAS